jgi:excisionase family DNA binding protein
VERAAELLGISAQIVHQRMDSGKLSFRQVGEHRKIPLADVLALKPLEDRRRSFASDLSADTEDLEENFALPPFSLENYELDRVPSETDEEYAARRAMFENLGPTSDHGSSERDEDHRFEVLAGVRTPLEDATENHEQIVANIIGALKLAMDRVGCRTYVRMAVRRGEESRETELRPDILVRRGPVGDRTYIDDPIVVIEVMSSASKPRDERLKHSFYRYMPTVRHIVLVDAERMTVQHDVRTEGGYDRSILADPKAVIDLTAVGFSIALEEVYSASIAA